MRRALAPIVVAACLIGLAWAWSSRDRIEERAERVTLQFDRSRDEVERLQERLRAVEHLAEAELEAERREKRRWRERYRSLRWDLIDARRAVRQLRGLATAVAPARGPAWFSTVVRSVDETRLLVVGWGTALQVWRLPPPDEASSAIGWRLVYEVVPDAEGVSVTNGGIETRIPFPADGVGFTTAHDLTDDGLRDLVVQAGTSGTGGCGIVWILENGTTLDEIFRREDCEHFVSAKRGLLVYDDAREPRWCRFVHGCGRKTTWLRWDGASWDVVRRTSRRA